MPVFQAFSRVLTLVILQSLSAPILSTSILSGSNARLPASLSSVINDLEAEGASRITTTAFLSSHGVTKKSRATLLATLFGNSDEEDSDDEYSGSVDVVDGLTTAFGKKLDDLSIHSDDLESETDLAPSIGIAIANPLPTASVSEIAATVHACGGNIVYVCSPTDLARGEGLFDTLAPAIERLLHDPPLPNLPDGTPPPAPRRTLVVVVEGATTQHQLVTAKARLEAAASGALETIVQPDGRERATTLKSVFFNIEYVTSNGAVDELLVDVADSCDPSAAAKCVGRAVFQGTSNGNVPKLTTPLDLAAARRLLPLSHRTIERCIETVRSATTTGDEEDEKLTLDFGALSDAAVASALEDFDLSAGSAALTASPVALHIRNDLEEELYAELETRYVRQLELLYASAKESFRGDLSSLRLSPNLSSDMQDKATRRIATFASQVGGLRSKSGKAKGWVRPEVWVGRLRRELREYVGLRIRTALADGKFKPVPRKGITLGFHWLLPKPFGGDYRLEPWNVHTKDSVVYIPKDKITDIGKEDVQTGDWRKSVVPCTTGQEMIYLK